jgi:hypothetical protein
VLCKLSLHNDAKQVGKVPKVVVEAKERIDFQDLNLTKVIKNINVRINSFQKIN